MKTGDSLHLNSILRFCNHICTGKETQKSHEKGTNFKVITFLENPNNFAILILMISFQLYSLRSSFLELLYLETLYIKD